MNMEFLKLYLFALVGTPYRWGGSDPMGGFDCSGLALECLIGMGVLPPKTDMTAQGLYDHFSRVGAMGRYGIGSLAFYGKDLRSITHIAVCIDEELMIEAGGGGSTTTSHEAAEKQDAFIRMRPILSRRDFLTVIKPSYMRVARTGVGGRA
jgi:cell wall-associated NlpC family hydrolase